MGETSLQPLKAILETIREQADLALKQLQESDVELDAKENASARPSRANGVTLPGRVFEIALTGPSSLFSRFWKKLGKQMTL